LRAAIARTALAHIQEHRSSCSDHCGSRFLDVISDVFAALVLPECRMIRSTNEQRYQNDDWYRYAEEEQQQ
jgi:hypothetical protein